MGWGTHEKALPLDGRRHKFGCDAAIYLNRPGLLTRVRTWTPLEGPFHGFIITHNESISIADYFTVRDGRKVVYRPTVHYAYHPCDQAIMSMHEIAGKNLHQQKRQRLIVDEITSGRDELGVAADGPQEGRLLVRLTARHPRDAQACALQQRDLDPGLRARPVGHRLGAWRNSPARHRRG